MLKKMLQRIPEKTLSQYSKNEEIANSVTHGLGILFAVISLSVLLTLASLYGSTSHIVSYIIYGVSMILLYTSSTLYHALPYLGAKKFFKICDHVSIYLLIAGTYTPFLVLNIKGSLGLGMLIAIWSCALLGIFFKFFFVGRYTFVSTLLYLAMGWMMIFAIKPLYETLNAPSFQWILTGGLTYTAGTVFYLLKKVPFHHAAWHICVLLGSIFHFTAIVYASSF